MMAAPILLALLSLLLVSFVAGLLPVLLISVFSKCGGPSRNKAVAFFLHFGTGAFFAVCMVILLPESRSHLEQSSHQHQSTEICSTGEAVSKVDHKEGFPIPEFILLCGFFATFAVEEAINCILSSFKKRRKCTDPRVRFCSCAKRHTECSRIFKTDIPDQTLFGLEREKTEAVADGSFRYENGPTAQVPNLDTNLLQSSIISQVVPNYGTVAAVTDIPKTSLPVVHEEAIDHSQVDNQSRIRYSMSNVLLLVVLVFHAALQGVNLGLAIASPNWKVLSVFCIQQALVVFIAGAIGLSNEGSLLTMTCFVMTLSVACPLGLVMCVLLENAMTHLFAIGVGQGLLCGSLLYFTFYDLLRRRNLREFSHWYKFIGFVLGTSLVIALDYVVLVL